jgi:hypothetical protein
VASAEADDAPDDAMDLDEPTHQTRGRSRSLETAPKPSYEQIISASFVAKGPFRVLSRRFLCLQGGLWPSHGPTRSFALSLLIRFRSQSGGDRTSLTTRRMPNLLGAIWLFQRLRRPLNEYFQSQGAPSRSVALLSSRRRLLRFS